MTTKPGLLGLHVADLTTETLDVGRRIAFSVLELETGLRIENDRLVVIAPDDGS